MAAQDLQLGGRSHVAHALQGRVADLAGVGIDGMNELGQVGPEGGIGLDEARRRIAMTVAARRMGRPEEFGDACAFLCAAQAGFISGQNLQLDGGSYPGLI